MGSTQPAFPPSIPWQRSSFDIDVPQSPATAHHRGAAVVDVRGSLPRAASAVHFEAVHTFVLASVSLTAGRHRRHSSQVAARLKSRALLQRGARTVIATPRANAGQATSRLDRHVLETRTTS